jgi:hypothetical protein
LRVQLLTTDEFADWFTALDESAAEDVATTLEVIAQLGTEKEAPGSSEWLTWYEHPSLSARTPLYGPSSVDAAYQRFLNEWGAFNGYARRVVKHLESPPFVARVGGLAPPDAAAVTDAVARIKRAVTRRWLALSDFQVRRRLGTRPLTPRDAEELALFHSRRRGLPRSTCPPTRRRSARSRCARRRPGFACSTASTPVATGVWWCSGRSSIGAFTATRSAGQNDYGKSS